MTKWTRGAALVAMALGVSGLAAQTGMPADAMAKLREGFRNPPPEARPMVRWWWFGAAVEKPEILRELEQMKADGIGGAELAFVYPEVLDDPAKGLNNLPFLSAPMLDAVNYAQAEGRRLGLRIDVTLCSGWPYGGPATKLSEASTQLRTVEIAVAAGATSAVMPKLAEGESLIAASIVNGMPNPPPRRGPGGRGAAPPANTWDAASAKTLTVSGGQAAVAASDAPRVALFFIQSHTLQVVKRAAVDAEGYVLDPFSHDAVATHLKAVGEPLVKAFGNTPPYAIFSDSLEAYGADWTPDLLAQFERRRGYDLAPHLAEIVGGGTGAGTATAEKVRHDYGRTLTELVNENYLTQIDDWAKAHGTKFRSQTYGEPAVSFSSQRLVALPEGEGPQWRAFSTLRWATSANHVFGNKVTSGETFTWLHSPVFRATPLDMKAEADIDFIMGENQLIFHGWPYSPPAGKVSEPGWSLYAAGVFNDHNPWHPVMPVVTKYIQRISWLLRQGEPANQVAILLPTDDAWASFSPAHVTVTGAMQKLVAPELMNAILAAGFNVDYIDADAIEKVGMGTHTVLVIPPTDRIPVATVKAINAWIEKGGRATMVGRVPTMDAEGKPLAVKLSEKIPVVGNVENLEQELPHAMVPDLQLLPGEETKPKLLRNIGYIRRRLPSADIYFVTNTSNEPVRMLATFGTTHKFGEQINPDSDASTSTSQTTEGRGEADVLLAPYESRVFLFGDSKPGALSIPPRPRERVDLSADWRLTFAGTGATEQLSKLTDWTANSATQHYSGEGVYSRDFKLDRVPAMMSLEVDGGEALPGAPNSPPEHAPLGPNGLPNPLITRPGPGMHAYFDPPIREAALVYINGQEAGALWHPPYRLEVSKLLKPGVNHIEIHVYNTALNAWSALPAHDYGPLIEKYGDRFQMQDLDKVKPVSSGFLGTIKLVEMEGGK